MTKYIDKDALIAEINQRIEDYKSHKIDDSYHNGLIFALKDLRDDFINSLQEEPVSEDLEEASHNYAESEEKRVGCGTEFFTPELVEAFKAGSQWQKEQFEKNRLAHCDALNMKLQIGEYFIPEGCTIKRVGKTIHVYKKQSNKLPPSEKRCRDCKFFGKGHTVYPYYLANMLEET